MNDYRIFLRLHILTPEPNLGRTKRVFHGACLLEVEYPRTTHYVFGEGAGSVSLADHRRCGGGCRTQPQPKQTQQPFAPLRWSCNPRVGANVAVLLHGPSSCCRGRDSILRYRLFDCGVSKGAGHRLRCTGRSLESSKTNFQMKKSRAL